MRIKLRLIPVLVGLGFALLMAAWVVATRPFGAPDENAHYLRALSITNGSLLGPKIKLDVAPPSRAELAWQQRDTRGVLVPALLSPVLPSGLAPAGALTQRWPCADGQPNVASGSCLEATYTGDYLPLPYFLPAVALSAAHSWRSGLWLSRAISACACLAFILLAIAALWSGSGWSLLGLLVAVTPMVLFISSVINPTGLETTAAIAFAAAGLRIVRDHERSPAWIWVLLACSGAVSIVAWRLCPMFVVIDVVVLGALLGRTRMRDVLSRSRVSAAAVTFALLAALALYAAWVISSDAVHSAIQITPGSLRLGIGQLDGMFRQAVGDFGWLTVPVRFVFTEIWWLLLAVLLAGAVLLGSWRERCVVVAVTVLVLVVPVVFYAWVYRFSGFGLQGRYMLPLLVLLPLVSGEVLSRPRNRIPGRTSKLLLATAAAAVAVIQLAAWSTSARAAAARQPHTWFMAHATWAPPLGWWPWAGMAIAGSAAIAASGAVALRRTPARAIGAAPQPLRGAL